MKVTALLLCALAVTAVVAQEEAAGEAEDEYEYSAGEYEVIFEYEFLPFTYLGPMEYEYEYEYEYNMWIPCEGQKKYFEPDCPCRPGIDPECDIPDIPCEEHYVRDCNDRCSPAFWIGNGQCDQISEKQAKRITKQNKSPMYANFNCETFWYDGGDCDLVDHMGRAKASIRETIKAQIAQAATSAPMLAVAALAVVALVAT